MIRIRKGVFETNSSSSHSIVLLKKDYPMDNKIDVGWHVNEDGIIDFRFEDYLEFGRTPFDLLTNWIGRLRYAIAYYGNQKIEELEKICSRRIARFKHFKFRKDPWNNLDDHGYVDHESLGLLDAALKKYNISLEEFIFNDRYIVVIDGDEYNVFDTFINTDMFNSDGVEDITSASYELEEGYWKNKENGK